MAETNMPDEQASTPVSHLRRILTNASWLTGSQFAGDVANLVLFVVLARAYGPEGIGQYAYGLGIAGLYYAFVNLGLEDLAVRECARTSGTARGALIGRLLLVQISALGIAVCILFVYLSFIDHTADAITLVVILVSQQVFFAFARTLLSPAYAEQRMIPAAIAQFVTRLLGIMASLVLVLFFELSLAFTVIPLAIGGLLLLVYSTRSCMSECARIDLSPNWIAIKAVLAEGWPFAASLGLSYLAIRSSYIVLNLMLGDSATGVYASAMKLMEVAVLPLMFLGLAAYPRLSSLYHTVRQEFYEAGAILVRVAVIVGIIVSWGLLYVAPYVIVPLLGAKFLETAPIVRSLAGLALLTSISFMVVRLMLASDRHQLRLLIQAIMVVVLLVTTIITVPRLGIDGAIFGMYASVMTSVVLTLIALGKRVNSKLAKPLAQLVFATFLAIAIASYAGSIFRSSVWPAIFSIAVFLIITIWFGLIPRHLFMLTQKPNA